MTGEEAKPRRRAGGGVALAFAIAALAASWNPIAAPFGLLVGIAAAVLGARALRRAGDRRGVPATALAVGVDLPGEPVVKGRTQAELDEALSRAGERTRAARERASKELDRLTPFSGAQSQTAPARDGGGRPPADAGSDAR